MMCTSEEAEVQVVFSNSDDTTVHRVAGGPPRLLLGLTHSAAGTLSSIVAMSWGNRRGLVEQGQFLRPGKKTRVPPTFQMGKGEGCKVHLRQPYFIVDSAGSRRLD